MQEKKQKISPIKQRILQFAKSTSLSMRDFYLKTKISRGTLESNTGITEDTIAKVIAAFDNISPLWLLTGEGEMLFSDSSDIKEVSTTGCSECAKKDEIINAQKETIWALRIAIDALKSEKTENKNEFKQTG